MGRRWRRAERVATPLLCPCFNLHTLTHILRCPIFTDSLHKPVCPLVCPILCDCLFHRCKFLSSGLMLWVGQLLDLQESLFGLEMIVKEDAGGRYFLMQHVAKKQRRMTGGGAGPCFSWVRTDCGDTNDAINRVNHSHRIDTSSTYSTLMTVPEEGLEGLIHTKAIVTLYSAVISCSPAQSQRIVVANIEQFPCQSESFRPSPESEQRQGRSLGEALLQASQPPKCAAESPGIDRSIPMQLSAARVRSLSCLNGTQRGVL